MSKRRAAPPAINTPTLAPPLPERIRSFVQQLMVRAARPGSDGEPDVELGGLAVALLMVANDAEQELATLKLQRDLAQPAPTPWAYEQACKALRKHHDRIAAVRALHHDWPNDPGHCAHCQDGVGTPLPYPCPTVRALDGVERCQP